MPQKLTLKNSDILQMNSPQGQLSWMKIADVNGTWNGRTMGNLNRKSYRNNKLLLTVVTITSRSAIARDKMYLEEEFFIR